MIADPPTRLRVLLVGAGRRIENNFLPALTCLSDDFAIVGIHARTPERMLPLAKRWNVAAVERLADVDFSAVDIVAISVPLDANASVLRALLPHARRLRIVIDTPIAGSRREFAAAAELLPRFASVIVTEDYMNFPQFALVRRALAAGFVGVPRSVTLTNIGFEYHGLALVRSFAGFAPYRRSWFRRLDDTAIVHGYTFDDGLRATIVGPYRRHTSGGIVVSGSAGTITEFPGDVAAAGTSGKPIYVLRAVNDDGELSGFRIEGGGRAIDVALPQLARMRAMDFADRSDFNLLRGCGLMTVLRALREPDNLNHRYGYPNALYDAVTSRLARHGRMPRIDPFAFVGSDYVAVLRAGMRALGRRTPAAANVVRAQPESAPPEPVAARP